jgi:four helix bundle suffix protein
VRKLGAQKNLPYKTYETYIDTKSPEVVANILICLIHQTNYLLDQLIRKLEKALVEEGGLRELKTRARLTERAKQKSP